MKSQLLLLEHVNGLFRVGQLGIASEAYCKAFTRTVQELRHPLKIILTAVHAQLPLLGHALGPWLTKGMIFTPRHMGGDRIIKTALRIR